MSTQPAGIPVGEGQPQPGNPTPTGQPLGQPPLQPTPGTPPTPQDNPQLAELQQKLASLEAEARKSADSAKFYQSNYDRAQQQLKAVVGAQPQADPNAEDVKFFMSQGYEEKDARVFVEFTNRKMAGITQQNNALQQSLRATSSTGQVLQAAASDRDYAPLFADPEIANAVIQELQRCAINGQADYVTEQYAKSFAEQMYASLRRPWLVNQQPAAQQQQAPRGFGGFNGPMPGFSPAAVQQQQAVRPPGAEIHDQAIQERFGIKP